MAGRNDVAPRVFVAVAVIQCIFLILAAICVLVRAHSAPDVENHWEYSSYGVLSLYVTLVFGYFAGDSIRAESVFQFAASMAISGLITLFVVFHVFHEGNFPKLFFIMAVAVGCFQLVYILIANNVFISLAFKVYKRIGANMAMKEMYRTAQIFFSLLKVDLALWIFFALFTLFLIADPSPKNPRILGLAFTFLFASVWTTFGWYGVRKENPWMVYAFAFTSLYQPALCVWFGVDAKWENRTAYRDSDNNESTDLGPSPFTLDLLVILITIFCVLRFVLVLYCLWAMKNFGKGLLNEVFARRSSGRGAGERFFARDSSASVV